MNGKIGSIDDLDYVGPMTAEKLRDAGYTSVVSVADGDPATLARVAGISELIASKIVDQARRALRPTVQDLQLEVAELRETVEKQDDRLAHLRGLCQLQALLSPYQVLVIDYGGPAKIIFTKRAYAPCRLCNQPIYSGDRCIMVAVKNLKTVLFQDAAVPAIEWHIHERCFYIATRSDVALPP